MSHRIKRAKFAAAVNAATTLYGCSGIDGVAATSDETLVTRSYRACLAFRLANAMVKNTPQVLDRHKG